MLFNSWSFLLGFLPITFFLYWFVFNKKIQIQNFLLLIASYLFYGLWDYRFLSLVIISSLTDYVVAQAIENNSSKKKRKQLLWVSIIVNLGMLGTFKYFDFFSEGFVFLFTQLGFTPDPVTLNIVLPVGISFYTFQTLGYTIDVYKTRVKASRDWLAFFTFVCFFPQLVTGPIERAKSLLPQFNRKRIITYESGRTALTLILWGLFMKVVVADSCGQQVDFIHANYASLNSTYLFLGQIYFAFQLYCDFAGYSNIAIGTAALFGFQLSTNFRSPLLSRSVPEFWSRWHITLTSWFTDYLFKPLVKKCLRNRFLIFICYLFVYAVIGLWHGPKLNYIIAIGTSALYYLPRVYFKHKRTEKEQISLQDIPFIAATFFIVSFHFILFRADSLTDGLQYMFNLFSKGIGPLPLLVLLPAVHICFLLIVEIAIRNIPLKDTRTFPMIIRWPVYLVLLYMVCTYLVQPVPFIYFQF